MVLLIAALYGVAGIVVAIGFVAILYFRAPAQTAAPETPAAAQP